MQYLQLEQVEEQGVVWHHMQHNTQTHHSQYDLDASQAHLYYSPEHYFS